MILLIDAGKRYNYRWIYRHFNFTFEKGKQYAITGPNGSGKSTLLLNISGSLSLNEGEIKYFTDTTSNVIDAENIFNTISYCSPALELIEEMTLLEFFNFHFSFKQILPSITVEKIIALLGLEKQTQQQLRYFSSGMKQRVKLAQSIFTTSNIILLDEPCTNLDEDGFTFYNQIVEQYCKEKLLIIASNNQEEYSFCKNIINISDYKVAED